MLNLARKQWFWEVAKVKNSICIVGLPYLFTKYVAKQFADELEMFYADVNDLLQFDLLDRKEAEKKSGKAYILKLETSKVKTVSSYENTVYTLTYSAITQNNNYEHMKENSLVIYLKLGEKTYEKALEGEKLTKSQKELALAVYKDRDYICSKISDIQVVVRSLEPKLNVSHLKKAVESYYEG